MAVLVAFGAGCGGDDEGSSTGSGGGNTGKAESISLTADTNRDGVIDDTDNVGEELWTIDQGAVFLPNLDDDNVDGLRDRDTLENDGQADTLDLALVNVQPFAGAPDGAVGRITIDPWAMPHVKIHKYTDELGWHVVGGSHGPCGAAGDTTCEFSNPVVELTAAEVKQGVVLGVEGKRLTGLKDSTSLDPSGPVVPWSGLVQLDYSVFESASAVDPITTEDTPSGVDSVQMRVASWVMYHNLTPQLDTVMTYSTQQQASVVFQQGVEAAVADIGNKTYYKVTDYLDQWNEDWLITGWVSMPSADGVHGMRLAYPRPFEQEQTGKLPVDWLASPAFMGPDAGYFVTYDTPYQGDSYDSGGNHDALPPYTNEANGQNFPVGRIIHGSGVIQPTKDFYEAQLVQGPALSVDTSWLIVGHVDEALSYMPANTERGWKLLVGSPDLAVEMLTEWQSQGHGAQAMFVDKFWSNGQSATITIDEALGDPDLMAWSQEGQAEIDGIEAAVVAEVGLTPDEIVYIPFLFERDFGALVAFNPGTVNSYVWDDHVIMPDPWGPSINGVDGFKQDLLDRIGTSAEGLGSTGEGMNVFFTDNWDLYHRLLGEVHCGTNFWGPPAASEQWWLAAE
jgi:protein-arginine deiminase